MITIDPTQLSEKENYKFLIGSIVPRPIAFVTSLSSEGVLNGAPFSFFNVVSSNPPLISISIQRSKGEMKDTARNITHTKAFVVHIVDDENVEKINQTSATLPPNQSELDLAKLTPVESDKIIVPGIKESKIRIECILERTLEFRKEENDDVPSCDLVIGRIVNYHIAENIYEDGKINLRGLGAMSRLAGNDYAKIGDIITIERPK